MEPIREGGIERNGHRMWILLGIFHRYMYVTERLTQKAWEQLRDLGIGRDVTSRQAVAALPLHRMVVVALEVGELWEQTTWRVQCVCSFADSSTISTKGPVTSFLQATEPGWVCLWIQIKVWIFSTPLTALLCAIPSSPSCSLVYKFGIIMVPSS